MSRAAIQTLIPKVATLRTLAVLEGIELGQCPSIVRIGEIVARTAKQCLLFAADRRNRRSSGECQIIWEDWEAVMPSIYAANDAAVYEKSMGRWSRRLPMPFIKFSGISEDLQGTLDVGCGTGSLAFAVGEVAPRARITGLDYSQAFVDYARSRADSDRFSFDQGDAVSLPYEAASFDATMSMLVLSFLNEPERAVREMVRVTRPGGVVAAAVWDFFGGHTFSRILLDTAAPLDPGAADLRAQHCSLLTRPGELATMWKLVGLRDVQQSEITIRMDFDSFNDIWEPWLGGQGTVGAYLVGLDDEKRRLIEHHTRQAYLVGEPDGPRSIAATTWVVRGTNP